MSDLRALYQEVILDHYKHPRNFGSLDEPMRRVEGYNPLCGDSLVLYVRLNGDDRIDDIAFEGQGCAISTASASLMTEAVKGRTLAEAEEIVRRFHTLLTAGGRDVEVSEELDGDLGKLEALSGVREYPVRIKCATLAWHALRSALEGNRETVTTE